MRFFQSFRWQRCDSREWKNSWAKVLPTEESSWKSGPAIWRKAADGEVTTPQSWTTNIAWEKSTKWMSRLVIFQAMLEFQGLILVGYRSLDFRTRPRRICCSKRGGSSGFTNFLEFTVSKRFTNWSEHPAGGFFLEFGRSIFSGHLWARCFFCI